MISPKTNHQLITDLDEARYTLSHIVDKTPEEIAVQSELQRLITHVRDLPVEGG